MTSRWCQACILCCLLLLSACSSTTFVYNRLDFILPWYVDDYAELSGEQEEYLDELLYPFLAWHRARELPRYLQTLDRIEASLNKPLTTEVVADISAEFERAWLRLEAEALDWLLDLGTRLSEAQVEQFMAVMWERQEEYEEEYLVRSEEEFYEDSYDNLLDSVQDYLGRLSPGQREQLREASGRLLRSDQAWLSERADWLQQLAVLMQREPLWQQRVREEIDARREHPSAEYLRIYEHNMGVIYVAIARLLNGRTDKQDRYLRRKLSDLREDLETLVAQGKGTAAGA